MSDERIFVVDRIEGNQIVLVGDDRSEFVLTRRELPVRVTEGSVLRVHWKRRRPDWSSATIDDEERDRRLTDTKRRMDALRKRDPGGDIGL